VSIAIPTNEEEYPMEEMLQEVLKGTGWTVENDAVLISPKGHPVEYDGTSPDGERSPLLAMGLI
tara:strand:+ start:2769 stop:2960 length:192 start_codon:yes stop_codon:yes gene_type:complete